MEKCISYQPIYSLRRQGTKSYLVADTLMTMHLQKPLDIINENITQLQHYFLRFGLCVATELTFLDCCNILPKSLDKSTSRVILSQTFLSLTDFIQKSTNIYDNKRSIV